MNESDLKSTLINRVHPSQEFFVFRHEDRWTAGVPDISANANKKTTWWEVKHVTDERPKVSGVKLQLVRMRQLARISFGAWYVIFEEYDEKRRTLIVEPQHVEYGERTDRFAGLEVLVGNGFNYQLVSDFMRQVHQ